MKLRTRLYAGLGAVAVAFAVTGFLIATTQQRYLTEQLDRELQSSVPVAMRVTDDRQGGPIPADDPSALLKLYVGHLAPDGTLTTLLVGETTTGTPSITPSVAVAHTLRGQTKPFTVDGTGTSDRFRVILVGRPNRPGWDIVALSLRNTDDAYQRLLIATAIGGLGVIGVIALIAAWVGRLGLQPIKQMTDAADAITAGDHERRMAAYPRGTEADHLARAFNTMLDERQAADNRLRQFVADASHELRTPLTSIRGYADLYRQGGLTDQARLDDAMRRVSGEAERMSSIVNDLLLLTNLDRGVQLALTRIDAAEVLHDAVADARAVQPGRPITLDASMALPCDADRQRLHQVVAALVHNALVHTAPDVAVEVSGRREPGGVLIEVVDHGLGMDGETAAHAFERFYRGDPSRSRHNGGSGLGLAIAKSIIEAHGGRIVLQTAPGQGCRFRIALPSVGGEPAAVSPSSG